MKIRDSDLHYGAALKQIADDRSFKSINADWETGSKSRCAFRINLNIGAYIKMGTEPKTRFAHYVFNFKTENLAEIQNLKSRCPKTFIVLVCLKDKEICIITSEDLMRLVEARSKSKGEKEGQYNLQVRVKGGGSMRVYMNAPGSKTEIVIKEKIVPRDAFPKSLFQ